jgi:light-regulated signal transduction histidine kinase (bacteriophytochrome)
VESARVLEAVEQNLALALEESGGVVEAGELPTVMADRSQLAMLLQNLIENALKFRGTEPPVVDVAARRVGGEWQFAVADNGIGIDPAFSDKIFAVFQRLHSLERYPGSGIGLAICKKIVERHGGRIWFESEPGQGTIFKFTLRAAEEEVR